MHRVLVIEDNKADLDLLTYLLETGGYTVTQAHDGQEGIRVAQATDPDLILCDILMPKASGYEVVACLRNRGLAGIPVVAVTILGSSQDRNMALAAGFGGYLPKPIDPEAFLGQVANFLRQPDVPPSH